ncbi:cation:proton antiporter [Psychromonas ossibalaenae]|uniref:cation:proton antiporter n=1 Tax=Psychromonas ossibalaenae TaxID=444922 RepID=UPI000370E4D1|nr:sodium:proton antiporter [Psychromonas ossibalaenae]
MNYSGSEILIAILVFLSAAVISKAAAVRLRIPFPIVLMLAGLVLHSSQEVLALPLNALTSEEFFHDIILMLLLPTIVFETAYNMDISKLSANRLAIFVLAVPGVLISTLVVAALVYLFTPLNWQFALLLGAVLSATDPSAVISVFRQLGAPKDLIMLIEGESLFNDATAITLTKILVLSFAAAQGFLPMLYNGSSLFLISLCGGSLCGWILARLLLQLFNKIPDDPFLEISLSLLLAFGSYLFAEKLLDASGIIAVTVAGITLATRSPLPISRKSQQYLNHLWSYLSFMAMACIFLMVGLWMDLTLLWQNAGVSLIVLGALWLSRALTAYALLPQIGRLQHQAKVVCIEYRHIVFVGGMRGAVTMALAMGLVTLTEDQTILSVTVNVVFLTTLLQGLLISPLVSYLGLKARDVNDSIACTELTLSALRHSRKVLQPLFNSTFANTGAPQEFSIKLTLLIESQEKQLKHWVSTEVGPVGLWHRLMLRCASIEIGHLYRLFDQGLIRTVVFEALKNSLDEQMEAVRHQYQRPAFAQLPGQLSGFYQRRKSKLTAATQTQIELEYEMAWARLFSCNTVLDALKTWSEEENIPAPVVAGVAKIWQGWLMSCEAKIALIEEKHPVISAGVQRRLLKNYLMTAQSEYLQQYVQQYLITEADAEHIKALLKSLQT